MTRGLGRALLLSILFHILLLVSLRQLSLLPDHPGNAAGAPIAALLRPDAREQPANPPPERSTQPGQRPLAGTQEILKEDAGEKRPPLAQGLSPLPATDNVAVAERAATIVPRPEPASAASIAPADAVSLDGVRQYRLNLAREARQAKTYPDLARQRGWEGVVVLVVTTVAGGALPQVELSQSSGNELLDRAAIELVGLSVRTASMPDSLRGQQFALTLPIHYRLAD